MLARRMLFIVIALVVALSMTAWLARVLGADGWTWSKALLLLCFLPTAPWLGVCAAHAVIGYTIQVGASDPVAAVLPRAGPPGALPRIAIVVTVRQEDMASVLPPLGVLMAGLDQAGLGFGMFILSDTPEGDAADAEAASVAGFAAHDTRVRYRRRRDNAGYKAGNIMEFLDHHAEGFEAMLTLDADSRISAAAVQRLARVMAADPALGLVQHLTVGLPAASPFPRLFQFGMRAGMRIWATAQSWWQGDEGPYWGHNALIRIAPFRAHCRLPALPDGSAILSHDQVEAVQLRAAGWGVRLLPEEDGSQEMNPPALPEFLRRELRWLSGNLQYRHLLFRPDLRPMGRWQLLQAILLFGGAPFQTAMIALAAVGAASGARVPAHPAAAFLIAWCGVIYAPKLLGYVQVLASARLRARYGGFWRFVSGAILEVVFSLLLDPITGLSKALCVARLALGAGTAWLPQNRDARGVTWAEAARLFWRQTVFGIVVFAAFAVRSWQAVAWAVPFAGGLLVAIPFCVATASPTLGDWMKRGRLGAIPEEIDP